MKTKSIWGNPPTRLYRLKNMAEKKYGKDYTVCIVGCSDGKFLMPFVRDGIKTTGYDIDDIALYGGIKAFPVITDKVKYKYDRTFISKTFSLEDRRVLGITERLEKENLTEYATIEKRDFYRNSPSKTFDVVFTSCSLHYSANKDFSLKDKTEKLQNIVNQNGYLYIDYMMAIEEDDYINYPPEKFYRKKEMLNYFNDDWKIISYRENNFASFEGAHVDCVKDHFHRFGYILAQRIK